MTIEYRIIKHSDKEYQMEYKKWFGWEKVYWVRGFSVPERFDTEQEADEYVKRKCKLNPNRVTFIKHPMLYIV